MFLKYHLQKRTLLSLQELKSQDIVSISTLSALSLTFFLKLKPVLVFNTENCGNVCHKATFLDATSTCLPSLVPCLKSTPQKQKTDVSLVLKDSDTDSENLSSLIRRSVSDGQITDTLNVV